MSRLQLVAKPTVYVPLSVVGVGLLLYRWFILCGAPEHACRVFAISLPLDGAERVAPMGGLLVWVAAAGLSLVAFGALIILSLQVIREEKNTELWPYVLFPVLPAGLYGLLNKGAATLPWKQLLNEQLLRDALGVVPVTTALDLGSLFAVLYMGMAFAALLRRVNSGDPASFVEVSTRANSLLYLGAVALTLTIFRLKALVGWSLLYVRSEAEGLATLVQIGDSLALAQGIFLAGILAAAFLPLANELNQKAHGIRFGTPEEAKEFFSSFSFASRVPAILAMLAPVVGTSLVDLLGVFA